MDCVLNVDNAFVGVLFFCTASVAEWLRAWDTLTMFEATV